MNLKQRIRSRIQHALGFLEALKLTESSAYIQLTKALEEVEELGDE